MRPSRPAFNSVLDLGLRDVGVRNEPRRLAAHFGRWSVPLLALVVVFAFAACLVLSRAGAGVWGLAAFAIAWTAVVIAFAVRMVKRAPVTVVKVTADGTNQATWLMIAPFGLSVAGVALTGSPLLLPAVALWALVAVLVWRGRGRVPELLREVRSLLEPGETVLGDGLGLVRGARGRHEALRVILATDRRLLVAPSRRSTQPFPLVDVPYAGVSRFGIEWKQGGRVGMLSLTLAADATVVTTSIAPANLISIALALQAHGVPADDPALVADAQRGWEEALQQGGSRPRVLDRGAMATREFDHGLWLLLGFAAVAFYLNPFGVGLGASRDVVPLLLGVPVVAAVCGYVSRTRSSLAYVIPLNLLVLPAFFFLDAGTAILVMVLLSATATVGLLIGSALRGKTAGTPAGVAPGSLRHAVSGVRLIRISGVLVAAMVSLVTASAAAGFELSSVRLAVEEASAQKLPADGRSDLTGGAASLTYTPGPGLHELITDEAPVAGPADGARWELRSSIRKGYNVVTLGHYVVEPRLDDPAALERFLAEKDRAHSRLAGFRVGHKQRVVDGRKGYVWDHGSRAGYWYYAAWFPAPVHSVRVECIARREASRFKRLCAEAMGSLDFRP